MQIPHGRIVAVSGLGGLGHLALQYAAKMGYKVAAISSSDAKKEEATSFGAKYYINTSKEDPSEALKKLGGADLIAVTANSGKLMTQLQGGLSPDGTLLTLSRKYSMTSTLKGEGS